MKSRAVKIETGHKTFEVWPGFSFSINIYEAGLFLCANVRAKVLPKHSVLDVMKITYREIEDQAAQRHWDYQKRLEEFRREVIKRVAGIQVRTMFNNKTYRVDDVDFRLSPGKLAMSFSHKRLSSFGYGTTRWRNFELQDLL